MPKTGLKAFVYSFSVSLFAIMAANRAIWHDKPSNTEPLSISSKNIVLFLKNDRITKSPVKKIALNTLPEITPEASIPSQPQPEIILASSLEDLDFPLEIAVDNDPAPPKVENQSKPVVLADILYSPEKPIEAPKIEAEPVYSPEVETTPRFRAPSVQPVVLAEAKPAIAPPPALESVKQPAASTEAITKPIASEDQALKLARAATAAPIPLQNNKDAAKAGHKITIGDPQDLDHIALNSRDIPIQSMEKETSRLSNETTTEGKNWQTLDDSPWVIAQSGGGAKNQLAAKQFAGKSEKDIAQALNPTQSRPEIQVASETVKNLLIPIPGKILEENDLTPKLAYPSTSEDAAKEKIIDAKIKQHEKQEAKTEKKDLLSPIEEDVILDVAAAKPEATPIKSPIVQSQATGESATTKTEKGGIIKALNSIFTNSPKTVTDAKEKAIAKAQAKRSFKKRLAKTRPVSIMPTEIRLSFQPNRAEISGQTLRWVQAFATKAAETPNMSLEIRIDGTSSMNLQQKRLNLLHNILTNKGVEYSKINTVFTSREPNSFILRTINPENNNSGGTARKTDSPTRGQYIQW